LTIHSRELLECRLNESNPSTRKWTRAELRFSDFRPAPASGDRIITVLIGATVPPSGTFYIDNMEIARPRR
jgi:hypothetical protein